MGNRPASLQEPMVAFAWDHELGLGLGLRAAGKSSLLLHTGYHQNYVK